MYSWLIYPKWKEEKPVLRARPCLSSFFSCSAYVLEYIRRWSTSASERARSLRLRAANEGEKNTNAGQWTCNRRRVSSRAAWDLHRYRREKRSAYTRRSRYTDLAKRRFSAVHSCHSHDIARTHTIGIPTHPSHARDFFIRRRNVLDSFLRCIRTVINERSAAHLTLNVYLRTIRRRITSFLFERESLCRSECTLSCTPQTKENWMCVQA